jgi:spore coat protein U-like protein
MLNRKSVIRAALGMIAGLGVATSSWGAGTATSSVIVTATVATNCTISTPTVAFGPYDGVAAQLTTDLNNSANSFSVNCTKSAPGVTIALGFSANATAPQRAMKDPATATPLNYNIYLPNATTSGAGCTFPGTTVWGNGTNGTVLTPTSTWGAGAANTKTFTLCGSVPAAQDPAAGTGYTDTVVATISF